MNRFEQLLAQRTVLVADGAMGTALFDLGLGSGGCPELLNVERPELIARVHGGYLDAGADIILTNTFGGTRARLALHGLQDRVAELNGAGVEIARAAASGVDRPVIVAGSVGPTGGLFEPLGPLSHAEGAALFSEQIDALVTAGVDVVWIETMSSLEELAAAVAAASGRGVPITTTMSFDTNGHTMMGVSPAAFAAWWDAAGRPSVALGANCGVGPPDVVGAAASIGATAPGAVVVAKGNCGIPVYTGEALSYPTGPGDMAAYAELAVRSGARIVGACCGSGFDHIAAIRAVVDGGIAGDPPSPDEIAERLGAPASAGERTAPRRTGRRRGGRHP